MSGKREGSPDTWWLLAGPATGVAIGVVLGAVSGWLATPRGDVGPLAGDPVGSTVIGALVGMTLGVFMGVALGAVLMFVIPPGQSALAARLSAAAVAVVCCPAVLLALAVVGRADLGHLGLVPFATVAAVGAGAAAWLASRRLRPIS